MTGHMAQPVIDMVPPRSGRLAVRPDALYTRLAEMHDLFHELGVHLRFVVAQGQEWRSLGDVPPVRLLADESEAHADGCRRAAWRIIKFEDILPEKQYSAEVKYLAEVERIFPQVCHKCLHLLEHPPAPAPPHRQRGISSTAREDDGWIPPIHCRALHKRRKIQRHGEGQGGICSRNNSC